MPERHLADLVEKQRAAVGLLEQAALLRLGVGEGAALVAEQLALQQVLRNRRAVHLDERPFATAGRVAPDQVGDQLLAGARLALHQHRRVGGLGDLVDHAQHLAIAADVPGTKSPIAARARPASWRTWARRRLASSALRTVTTSSGSCSGFDR